MKICYLANSRFPSERAHMTQIVQMCNAFVENGHEVTLLVTDRSTDITQSPEVFFGVPLLFSVSRINVPDIAGRSPKIPVILRPYLFLLQRLVFAYRAFRVVTQGGYTHMYGRDEGILFLLSRFSKIPVIWESHEAKFSYTVRRLLTVVHSVIVISEGILNFYIKQGVKRELLHVAHDAIDDRFFMPLAAKEEVQKKLGITSKKPLVLYIGELDSWKGVDTLFGCVSASDPFTVGIIGGKEEEIKKYAVQHPAVTFFGRRPYRELPLYQQAADILVIPNTAKNALSNEYTSPLKLFAYMTSKKPIIASRIPSIQNIVSDAEVYFFTPDNASDLHDVILSVLQSSDRGTEKALRAYEKSTQFTWKKRAQNIADCMGT